MRLWVGGAVLLWEGYLGESPPWEQLVGEVSGLLRLLGCLGGVRPAELLGDACKSTKYTKLTQKHPEITSKHLFKREGGTQMYRQA